MSPLWTLGLERLNPKSRIGGNDANHVIRGAFNKDKGACMEWDPSDDSDPPCVDNFWIDGHPRHLEMKPADASKRTEAVRPKTQVVGIGRDPSPLNICGGVISNSRQLSALLPTSRYRSIPRSEREPVVFQPNYKLSNSFRQRNLSLLSRSRGFQDTWWWDCSSNCTQRSFIPW